ncbi:MAG: PhzF family phenazine biosynthesis protein [bacterium]|nr:MAG: PhzF family phenazine biosynthesis protein [bacterium]
MKTLNVFTNEKGEFGNPVGIIVDSENKIDDKKRQQMAINSGFSEIVFINNLETKDVSIFSPTRQIPFAGHALVGTSYFFNNVLNLPTIEIISMGKVIKSWQENKLTFVEADLSILPNWNIKEYKTPEEIEQITIQEASILEHTLVWCWIDKEKGLVRARTFASDWDIPEDEANGSGAMKLASLINRNLIIHHGKGSVIHSTPSSVGGLVKLT